MPFRKPTSTYNMAEKSDSELVQLIGRASPGSEIHGDAVAEREYRQRKHDFWSKNVVSWIALGLSIVAILISLRIIRPLG
jgi:hypothetical protein